MNIKKALLLLLSVFTFGSYADPSFSVIPIGKVVYQEHSREDVNLVYSFRIKNNSAGFQYLNDWLVSSVSPDFPKLLRLRNTNLSTCGFYKYGVTKMLSPKGTPGDQCSFILSSIVPIITTGKSQFYMILTVSNIALETATTGNFGIDEVD